MLSTQFPQICIFCCWYFCIFLPLLPLEGQPAVIIPTLLAPQQGMTCPCRLERCRIRTQDCRFKVLQSGALPLSHHIPLENSPTLPAIIHLLQHPLFWRSCTILLKISYTGNIKKSFMTCGKTLQ